jgi:hypothetical protein
MAHALRYCSQNCPQIGLICFDPRPADLPEPQALGIKVRIRKGSWRMNRNLLYFIVGALVVATAVVSYLFYQERQKTSGIDINVDKGGISIETK